MDRDLKKIDPEMLKNAKKLDKESLQLSKELLDKVSGGDDITAYQSDGICPRCHVEGLIFYVAGGILLEEYCPHCGYDCNFW